MPYLEGYLGGYTAGIAEQFEPPGEPQADQTPDVRFWVALEDPLDVPVWIEETHHLRGWNVTRARSGETDEQQTGTMTAVLDNRDGRFDAANTEGPYYLRLDPLRRVRLAARLGNGPGAFTMKRSVVGGEHVLRGGPYVVYLFQGYVDSFPQQWDIGGQDATVTIEAADAFSLFDRELMPREIEPITGQLLPISVHGFTGDAIADVLNRFGWPDVAEVPPIDNTFADIAIGNLSLSGDVLVTGTFLEVMRKLTRTEGGQFFMARDGRAVFRAHDYVPREAGIWGDADGEHPYGAIELAPASATLWNDITVKAEGGATRTGINAISTQRFGTRSKEFDVYPLSVDDLGARVGQLLSRYSLPRERLVGLKPLGKRSLSTWRTILECELGDALTVRRRPPAGYLIEWSPVIEGITIDSPNHRDWNVHWTVSTRSGTGENILSEAQSDFESDPTGWLAESNCTALRVDPSTFPDEDYYGGRNETLRHRVVAFPALHGTGTLEQRAVDGAFTMTAITEDYIEAPTGFYHGAASVKVGLDEEARGGHVSAQLELVWYDEDQVFISVTASPLTALSSAFGGAGSGGVAFGGVSANGWFVLDVRTQPPVGAEFVRMRLRGQRQPLTFTYPPVPKIYWDMCYLEVTA